eukprot:Transcript_31632.p1 GENE.Transcript_31632~~Transcript_31632.p1  ORF type:complete len:331 (+),score=32.74 Transcript_31632:102-1094(+)
MLAADKTLLQTTVLQRAIQLREKELNLFNDNFNAVGTQSAVLAGFAMTSFAEIDLPHNAFYAQKACLHLFVTISICANLMCTASTTFVSVWGSGKALRGKDGSMNQAVDGMNDERAFIFTCFGVGLITTLLALMSAAWILMTLEVAFVATCGVSWSIYVIVRQVHPPPSTRPRPKPRLPGPERCRAARVAGSPHPPEVWAQQGRHRHLRGHARCGGRQAVPPLVRGASSPEGGGSPPPPPALRRHWAPVAFEHAGPPAARKRSSTTTSRTRAQGSSRASRRRLARGQKARTTYEPRRLGATPCARTCCLRGTDMRPRVSFADTLCYCGGA